MPCVPLVFLAWAATYWQIGGKPPVFACYITNGRLKYSIYTNDMPCALASAEARRAKAYACCWLARFGRFAEHSLWSQSGHFMTLIITTAACGLYVLASSCLRAAGECYLGRFGLVLRRGETRVRCVRRSLPSSRTGWSAPTAEHHSRMHVLSCPSVALYVPERERRC